MVMVIKIAEMTTPPSHTHTEQTTTAFLSDTLLLAIKIQSIQCHMVDNETSGITITTAEPIQLCLYVEGISNCGVDKRFRVTKVGNDYKLQLYVPPEIPVQESAILLN